MNDKLILRCKSGVMEFSSRLLIGTGKYTSFEENHAALVASGAEIITVAVRRVNIELKNQPLLQDFIDPKKVHISSKYSRLLYGRRRNSHAAFSSRTWWLELGEVRSSFRSKNPLSKYD